MLEMSLVRPDLTNDQVIAGLDAAVRQGVAAAAVRGCDVDLAIRSLGGSAVVPGAVCGFPHGTATTGAKLYELRDLLRRGAKQVELVANTARLLSRAFPDVQTELLQASEACRKESARLVVTLETHYLKDDLIIIACGCCERADVHAVRAGTGFAATLATPEQLRIIRRHVPEDIAVEAAGVGTLDGVMDTYELGCSRVAIADPAPILDEWKQRLARLKGTPES
jgi:deoxyribose-phosphate aldolase